MQQAHYRTDRKKCKTLCISRDSVYVRTLERKALLDLKRIGRALNNISILILLLFGFLVAYC